MKRTVNVALLTTALLHGGTAFGQPCTPNWDNAIGQPGLNHEPRVLEVFDLGEGPALYVGGIFNRTGEQLMRRIAKWDGASWSELGSGVGGGSVEALAVFDDGTGPALYVGGFFAAAGGQPANNIAKWDGASWSAMGSGMDNAVEALLVFDDGSGASLYAAGRFATADGQPANNIAKWDGVSWSRLGAGIGGTVLDLSVFDDGSGPALYAGGSFNTAGGQPAVNIAKWDGTSWSPLGSGAPGNAVIALTVFDDGTGEALYAGGLFSTAGGLEVNNIAKWDGESWSALGSGVSPGYSVKALTVFDDGTGRALYAGGRFDSAGRQLVHYVAKWDGMAWSALGSGVRQHSVTALTAFDDGMGPALFVGGEFTTAGGQPASSIAAWRGCPSPCYADCDQGGTLDFFDFLCFQNLFATGDPRADCDGSGSLDFFDFLCFQNAFAAGCP